MDKDIVKLLKKDLGKARLLRDCVKESENYGVVNSIYLNPVTNEIVLPMNHSYGLSVYFQKMVEILEEALDFGSISEHALPNCCPRWLEELVK